MHFSIFKILEQNFLCLCWIDILIKVCALIAFRKKQISKSKGNAGNESRDKIIISSLC